MPLISQAWHKAISPLKDLPVAPQLPMLLRPEPDGPSFSCLLCNGASGTTAIHRLRMPEELRGARFLGSSDDRTLLLCTGARGDSFAVNVRTEEQHLLPNMALLQNRTYPMVILAATLSCATDKDYIGAAIVQGALGSRDHSRRVAFWKKGDSLAIDPYCYADGSCVDIDAEDIIWDNGSCSVLTDQETLQVWKIKESDGVLRFSERRMFYIKAGDARYYEEKVTALYLVHSRGDLLMIVRYSDWKGRSTAGFRIFKKKLNAVDTGCELTRFEWNELLTLEGRIIFVARACSRSYEASDYPGLKEGVYFLDERDPVTIGGNQVFCCNDTGKWSGPPPAVESCFPPKMHLSTYSSPGWLLP